MWKTSYSPTECRKLASFEAQIERCGQGSVAKAAEAYTRDPSLCVPFSEPTLLTGIWVSGFEDSDFYEGASSYSEVAEATDSVGEQTWFSTAGKADEALLALPSITYGTAFKVEIIGQKSLCEGEYGHAGLSSREVVARHFLSIRPIQIIIPPEE